MADSGASSEAGSSTLGNPILSSPAGGAGGAAAGPSSAAAEVEIVAGDGEPQRKYARTQKRAELHPEAKLSDEQRVTMDKLLEQLVHGDALLVAELRLGVQLSALLRPRILALRLAVARDDLHLSSSARRPGGGAARAAGRAGQNRVPQGARARLGAGPAVSHRSERLCAPSDQSAGGCASSARQIAVESPDAIFARHSLGSSHTLCVVGNKQRGRTRNLCSAAAARHANALTVLLYRTPPHTRSDCAHPAAPPALEPHERRVARALAGARPRAPLKVWTSVQSLRYSLTSPGLSPPPPTATTK